MRRAIEAERVELELDAQRVAGGAGRLGNVGVRKKVGKVHEAQRGVIRNQVSQRRVVSEVHDDFVVIGIRAVQGKSMIALRLWLLSFRIR